MKSGNGVKGVRPLDGYVLRIVFTDGFIANTDLEPLFRSSPGPMTAPFKEVEFFQQAEVDAETDVVRWPNGYDICSDVLRHYCELGRVSTKDELDAHFCQPVETNASSMILKDQPSKS